jgi:hypothetical protein
VKINATNDIEAAAWMHHGSPRVFIRFGWQKYTATAEEATELAGQILAAVKALREAGGDVD